MWKVGPLGVLNIYSDVNFRKKLKGSPSGDIKNFSTKNLTVRTAVTVASSILFLQSFFVVFDLNLFVSSLTSSLSGEKPDSGYLFPEEDKELTLFWFSGMTLSARAEVIALFICVCIMDISVARIFRISNYI